MKYLILLFIAISSLQLSCCPCGAPANNSKPFFEQYDEEGTEATPEEEEQAE